MKRRLTKYLTDARKSAILLLIAAFITIVVTLLTQESDTLRSWLYGSTHSAVGYILKFILILLWVYPTLSLLCYSYLNNEWKKTLSVVTGLLLLFFVTAIIIACLTA